MIITPRKFDSEIRISKTGAWYFRGQEITQENVLNFFKKNTREDEAGIYITNSYAELTEHGYLEAQCIFLKIIDFLMNDNLVYLVGENETVTAIDEFNFFSDADGKIFCMRKVDNFIKFLFNRQVHTYISSLVVEENGNYFLNLETKKLPIISFNKPLEVMVPDAYRTHQQ